MSARLRKKKLYRRISNTFDQMLCCLRKKRHGRGWHLIQHDAMRAFGNDRLSALIWFITPAIALDGSRPADLVATGNLQLVQEHLTRLEYGVYT
jgi:uncharacterized protein (DUF2384 family)